VSKARVHTFIVGSKEEKEWQILPGVDGQNSKDRMTKKGVVFFKLNVRGFKEEKVAQCERGRQKTKIQHPFLT